MLPVMNEDLVGYIVTEDFGKSRLVNEITAIKDLIVSSKTPYPEVPTTPEGVPKPAEEPITSPEITPPEEAVTPPTTEIPVVPPPTLPVTPPTTPYIPVTTTIKKKTNWLLLGSLAFLGLGVAVYAAKKRGG